MDYSTIDKEDCIYYLLNLLCYINKEYFYTEDNQDAIDTQVNLCRIISKMEGNISGKNLEYLIDNTLYWIMGNTTTGNADNSEICEYFRAADKLIKEQK